MGRRNWQLTYLAPTRRWKKKHAGKIYYFPLELGETKETSYARCVALWQAKKAALDESRAPRPYEREYAYLARSMNRVITWLQQNDHQQEGMAEIADLKAKSERISKISSRSAPPEPQPEDDPFADLDEPSHWLWLERLHTTSSVPTHSKTIEETIHSALQRRQARVRTGDLAAQRHEAFRCHLEIFQDWFGANRAMDDVNAAALEDFHTHLLQCIDSGVRGKTWDNKYSSKYAKDVLASVKQFIKRSWERGEIADLPRNLSSPEIAIKHISKPPAIVPDDAIHAVLNVSSDRTRLFILLMLNCGMQQKDIASIRHEEVDWQHGRLTRKRQKTKRFSTVPVVTYKLWPETFTLLKQFRSNDHQVLLNEEGQPLYQERERPDGHLTKIDNIRCALIRAMDHAKIHFAPKLLRKTSSSRLAAHPQYRTLYELFLAHAPSSVAQKHYIVESPTVLDCALDWLHDQYFAASALPSTEDGP